MVWDLDKHSAKLTTDSFSARFNGEDPYLGLELLNAQGASCGKLFSFLLSESPVETYVRGSDLVSKYPPRHSDLVSYETYYRIADDGDSVDFVLSAQTSLLDSAPLTKITSEFSNATMLVKFATNDDSQEVKSETALQEAPQFVLLRPNDDESHSWVLLIHPTDFHRGTLRLKPSPSVVLRVFPEFLEKGVIRRATMKCCRVARENDTVAAQSLFENLSAAAPPLAT